MTYDLNPTGIFFVFAVDLFNTFHHLHLLKVHLGNGTGLVPKCLYNMAAVPKGLCCSKLNASLEGSLGILSFYLKCTQL